MIHDVCDFVPVSSTYSFVIALPSSVAETASLPLAQIDEYSVPLVMTLLRLPASTYCGDCEPVFW